MHLFKALHLRKIAIIIFVFFTFVEKVWSQSSKWFEITSCFSRANIIWWVVTLYSMSVGILLAVYPSFKSHKMIYKIKRFQLMNGHILPQTSTHESLCCCATNSRAPTTIQSPAGRDIYTSCRGRKEGYLHFL